MTPIDRSMTRIPALTPTKLATYERCPRQYRHKYLDKWYAPQPFNRDLACGTAAHAVLHGVMDVYRRTGGYPIDLRERVEDALPTRRSADSADWATDVGRVLAWVKPALASIDESARVVGVERWLELRFPGNDECGPFLLRHCVDLILEHPDGTVEHRDWKTGKRAEVDALQTLVARMVVGHAYRRASPTPPRILSSTAFLEHGLVQVDELPRAALLAEWRRIVRSASRIMTEQDWHPRSNALCPWCPLYQNGCELYGAPDAATDRPSRQDGAA